MPKNDLKAYNIGRVEQRRGVWAECRRELPFVRCDKCGREWGDGLIEFPALDLAFMRELKKEIVNVEEFRRIRKRIESGLGRPINVIPGCAFGGCEGEASEPLKHDFIWGSICSVQISRRARDLLATDGIELLTAETKIKYERKRLDYLAIQLEPVPMLTEETLQKADISFCSKCEDYFQNYPKPNMDGHYEIRREAWPKGQHLVMLIETLKILASPEFMTSVAKHRLSNIRFIEYGVFV